MGKKRGRPKLPKGEAKRVIFPVRLSADEKRAILEAAKRAGKRPSEWVRNALIQAAGSG